MSVTERIASMLCLATAALCLALGEGWSAATFFAVLAVLCRGD